MTLTPALDIKLAIGVASAMAILVLVKGDAMYVGVWYYVAVPAVILGACAALRPAPLFLAGAASAIAVSMLAVMSINWSASRPEGLLGFAHLFSLPGAFVSVLVTAVAVRKRVIAFPFISFFLGFGGLLVGYFLNQLVVFDKIMWHNPLSLFIK